MSWINGFHPGAIAHHINVATDSSKRVTFHKPPRQRTGWYAPCLLVTLGILILLGLVSCQSPMKLESTLGGGEYHYEYTRDYDHVQKELKLGR